MTVLHEMLHVEKPEHTGHGWQFDQRMLRLAPGWGTFDGNAGKCGIIINTKGVPDDQSSYD